MLKQRPALTFLAAAAIFLADTLSPVEIGFAALYVAVLMLSATFLNRQGLLAVGVICMLLTLASFAIVHGSSYQIGPLIRCLVALSTISITTFVARKYQQVTQKPDEQAVMLDPGALGIIPEPVVRAVDDELSFRDAVSSLLRAVGLQVKLSGSAMEPRQGKLSEAPSRLVLEIRLSGIGGLDFQTQLSEAGVHVPVVFIAGHGDISMVVKATKEEPSLS